MIVRPEAWIIGPDAEGDGLLKAWAGHGSTEFPLSIETHGVFIESAAFPCEKDFELFLECVKTPDVYRDEEAFRAAHEHFSMASESVIPIGLLSPPYDARVLLNGVVTEIYDAPAEYGFGEKDTLFSFSCLGNEYDAVYYADAGKITLKEGNIVSCVYRLHGVLRESI